MKSNFNQILWGLNMILKQYMKPYTGNYINMQEN